MDDFDDLSDEDYGFDNDFSSASDADHNSDQFDQLRRSSARSETMFNELDDENRPTSSSGSGFSLSNFSAGQRLVLALLVVLDIIVIGILFVVLWGIISG
ncbi:MAG: hypothetical protein HND44_21520 [Chloroflexi bacterium]|nr:hypothetical protein [Ardenticatenaceae bacterium]MBL1131023.1 hypothetical protein [Chloroflexota bacterium]NOG37121.1 hypothetical protein [Chloroflexota bacterium]